jgi:hypothetical protein
MRIFSGVIWGVLLVYLAQFLGFLTRFFYDNVFDDTGSVADGGIISVIIIIETRYETCGALSLTRVTFKKQNHKNIYKHLLLIVKNIYIFHFLPTNTKCLFLKPGIIFWLCRDVDLLMRLVHRSSTSTPRRQQPRAERADRATTSDSGTKKRKAIVASVLRSKSKPPKKSHATENGATRDSVLGCGERAGCP